MPVPDAGIPREIVEAARARMVSGVDTWRSNTDKGDGKSRRAWELSRGLIYCGECEGSMGGYSVTHHRAGRRVNYFYYVCFRAAKRSILESCSNRRHPADALERKVGDSVARLFRDPERLYEQIDRRIERERDAMRDPEREALRWARRLEEIDEERKRSQKMAVRGQMDLDVLDEILAELKDAREVAERELATARDRQGRIQKLENEATVVLALYSGFAGADLGLYPPEERRRLYEALGLRVTVHADERVEIDLNPVGASPLPSAEKAQEMVESILYDPERQKAHQEMVARIDAKLRRAGREHLIPEERRSVMSSEMTSRRG